MSCAASYHSIGDVLGSENNKINMTTDLELTSKKIPAPLWRHCSSKVGLAMVENQLADGVIG